MNINEELIYARELAYYDPESVVDVFLRKLPNEISFTDRKFLSYFDNIFKDAVNLIIEEFSKYKLDLPKAYNNLHQTISSIIEMLAIYDQIIILDDLTIIKPYEVISYTTEKNNNLIFSIKYYAPVNTSYRNIYEFKSLKDNTKSISVIERESETNEPIGILLSVKSHFPEIIRENIILLNLQSMINYGYYKDSYNMLLLKSDSLMAQITDSQGKAGYGERNKGSVEVGGAIIVGANEDAKVLSPSLNNIHNFENYVWKIRDNIIKKAGLDIKFDGIEKSGVAYIVKNKIIANKIKPFLKEINSFLQWYSSKYGFEYALVNDQSFFNEYKIKEIIDIINNDVLSTPAFVDVVIRDYINKNFPYLSSEKVDEVVKSIIQKL